MKNDKRLLKIFFIETFFILFLCLPFSSCKIVSTPIQVLDATNITFEEFVQIKASIINFNKVQSNDSSLYSSPESARSINPKLQAQDYDFYLFGQKRINETAGSFGPLAIKDLYGTSGAFSMEIPRGTWYLTLAAYEKDTPMEEVTCTTIGTKALLTGSVMSDFSTSGSPVSFMLSASGLTTYGTINLTINFENWKISDYPNYEVSARLIETATGNSVINSEITELYKSNDGTYVIYNPKEDSNDLDLDLEVKPGKYNFELNFYDSENHSFTWSDSLYVYPGQATETEIFIPKIMDVQPTEPSSIDFEIDTLNVSNDGDYFPCTFTWTQESSTTATYYELKLRDILTSAEKIYSQNSGNKFIEYIEGSLSASSSSIKIFVELGHEYEVSLRSVNAAGNSDWITNKSKKLNYYRITYFLQGGKTTEANVFGEEEMNSQGPFYFYGSNADGKRHEWKNPGSGKLKNGNLIFNFWTSSPSDTNQYPPTETYSTYSGYSNMNLYAKYVSEYTIPEGSIKYAFENNELKLEFNLNPDKLNPANFKNCKAEIKDASGNIKGKISLFNITADTPTPVQKTVERTVDSADWASGNYTCNVTATDINDNLVSYTFTFEISKS